MAMSKNENLSMIEILINKYKSIQSLNTFDENFGTASTIFYKITNEKKQGKHRYKEDYRVSNSDFDESFKGFYITNLSNIWKWYREGKYLMEVRLPFCDPTLQLEIVFPNLWRANMIIYSKGYDLDDIATYKKLVYQCQFWLCT